MSPLPSNRVLYRERFKYDLGVLPLGTFDVYENGAEVSVNVVILRLEQEADKRSEVLIVYA